MRLLLIYQVHRLAEKIPELLKGCFISEDNIVGINQRLRAAYQGTVVDGIIARYSGPDTAPWEKLCITIFFKREKITFEIPTI